MPASVTCSHHLSPGSLGYQEMGILVVKAYPLDHPDPECQVVQTGGVQG